MSIYVAVFLVCIKTNPLTCTSATDAKIYTSHDECTTNSFRKYYNKGFICMENKIDKRTFAKLLEKEITMSGQLQR